MGTCLSKKKLSSSSSSSSSPSSINKNVVSSSTQASVVVVPVPVDPNTSNRSKHEKQQEPHQQLHEEEKQEEPTQMKKEIFLIKHRKSHDDRDRNAAKNPLAPQNQPPPVEDSESAPAPAVVRTSSCTKEEVDAILIQCGRLSRSSSGKAASSSSASRTRKYSGSKRSYDFDNNLVDDDDDIVNDDGAAAMEEKRPRERQRSHRRSSSRGSPSPQERRRRTPSRERDSSNNNNQQRSSSRERRVSRSPGRRCPTESAAPSSTNSGRPGKMVSIPATVSSSLVMDKSNNLDSAANANAIKRISVKRNVGEAGSRSAASPRSQSPARGNGSAKSINEQQQQPSLSRNSSRKAEQSPYRRNPLSEVDPNSLAYPNSHNTNSNNSRAQTKSKREISVTEGDDKELPTQAQKPNAGTNYRSSSRVSAENKNSQPQQAMVETTVVISGADNKPQQALTRSRSSRRSRDLDINPEILLNPTPTPSYTRLLLADIQNFHQKNTTNPNNTTTTVVSLPPCVSKACSILEAVADLNSTTGSNLSCSGFSEDQLNKGANNTYSSLLAPAKEPFLQSEVIVDCDDLTEPSFHKYVTVRRGGGGSSELVVDSEDQESSGSNSFVGGSQVQNWGLSSSSWEPNSAESTDCWTSRSNMREEERLSGRKRDSNSAQPQHSGGIGRGRLGSAKGLHTASVAAGAAST